MPTVIRDPTPSWLKKENASVFDSPTIQAIRWLAGMIGADDPQSQVLGLMNPTEVGPTGGLAGAMQRLAAKGKKPITAYHGSPHDFDKFSMEKIGTGEGAQAYGHGLYFAENPDVAADYKNKLGSGLLVHGKQPDESTRRALEFVDENVLRQHGSRAAWDDAITRTSSQADFYRKTYAGGDPSPNLYDHAVERLKALSPDSLSKRGKTYEVAINADPEDFLDWDKSVSEQSPSVGERLRKSFSAIGRADPEWADWARGEHVYTSAGGGDPALASKTLKQGGIPGIKYLDQGSRSAGEGTRNYVVFDAQIIDIMKKYGVPAAVAASLARSNQEPSR